MQEQIRYAWGKSSLGDFIAAVSDVGLLAFEFGDNRTAMLSALESRLPDASVVNDQDVLAGTVAELERVVDHPGQDSEIVLDMRGSDYQKHVWAMLREIPGGETTSYGALVAKLGTRDARDVTEAIGSNTIAILIPCHRVIKKDGSISGYRWGVRRKRSLLERERHTRPIDLTEATAPETVLGGTPFNDHLRTSIDRFALTDLFCDDGPGRHHQAIRPTGYDYYVGAVDAAAMEKWRADYRAMSPAQQMFAATIIWLYRGGKDNRWLRRVPCTWHAVDAVGEMQRSDILADWGILVSLYPGW